MRFKETWHLLAHFLVGLADNSSGPRPEDLVIVYNFVLAVSDLLSVRKNIALVEFVDELDNNNLLKPQWTTNEPSQTKLSSQPLAG